MVSLFIFLGLAAWEDCHTQKVSNILIFTAFINALLYQFTRHGFASMRYSFFQSGTIVLLLFPLYLCKALGAGDVKMLGVTAAFLSWRRALWVFFFSLYFALLPLCVRITRGKRIRGCKVPLAAPIMAGALLLLWKEGYF